MKKYTLLFLIGFLTFSSCGREYSMKSQFEEEYKKIMNDPSSFELVSFTIAKEAYSYSQKNRKHIDSLYLSKISSNNRSKHIDSIIKVEQKADPYFTYTQVLVDVRGKNLYGAKVLKTHVALYSDLLGKTKLRSIDGREIY